MIIDDQIKRDLCKCYNQSELADMHQMIQNGCRYYYKHILDCYNISESRLKKISNEMLIIEL